jgi:hypothetical protein
MAGRSGLPRAIIAANLEHCPPEGFILFLCNQQLQKA